MPDRIPISPSLPAALLDILAAAAEIAGCFAACSVLRRGRSAVRLASGLACLALLAWLWLVEGARPDR